MSDSRGFARKVGFKKGNKHSPHKTLFPEAAVDDSAAFTITPTAASSSSSAVQALYIPTTARDLGSASSSSSAYFRLNRTTHTPVILTLCCKRGCRFTAAFLGRQLISFLFYSEMNIHGYTLKRRRGFQKGNTACRNSPEKRIQITDAPETVSPTATSSSTDATDATFFPTEAARDIGSASPTANVSPTAPSSSTEQMLQEDAVLAAVTATEPDSDEDEVLETAADEALTALEATGEAYNATYEAYDAAYEAYQTADETLQSAKAAWKAATVTAVRAHQKLGSGHQKLGSGHHKIVCRAAVSAGKAQRVCAWAGCSDRGLKTCTRCYQTRYCGVAHQTLDWGHHKIVCRTAVSSEDVKG